MFATNTCFHHHFFSNRKFNVRIGCVYCLVCLFFFVLFALSSCVHSIQRFYCIAHLFGKSGVPVPSRSVTNTFLILNLHSMQRIVSTKFRSNSRHLRYLFLLFFCFALAWVTSIIVDFFLLFNFVYLFASNHTWENIGKDIQCNDLRFR